MKIMFIDLGWHCYQFMKLAHRFSHKAVHALLTSTVQYVSGQTCVEGRPLRTVYPRTWSFFCPPCAPGKRVHQFSSILFPWSSNDPKSLPDCCQGLDGWKKMYKVFISTTWSLAPPNTVSPFASGRKRSLLVTT